MFLSNDDKNDFLGPVLTYLIVFYILIGLPGNGLITLLDLISIIILLLARKNCEKEERKTLTKAIIFFFIPAITMVLILLILILM
jgi:hypothetical protein